VDRGRAFLARSERGVGARFFAFVLVWMGAALAALGELEEAEVAMRAALPRLKAGLGSAHMPLNYVAYLLARQGRVEDGARLIGYIDGSRTGQSILASAARRRAYDSALAIIDPILGAEQLDRLRAEGRSLTEDEAIALAFARRA
jgi:hypothetical protein